LAASLEEVNGKLHHLAHSTEADFLEVGGRLQRIMSRAQGEARALTDLLEKAQGRRQPVLGRALDEVCAWTESATGATATEPLIAALEPVVCAAGEPLGALEDSVRVLRVLRFSTRIESAWLGNQAAGFAALAEEMRSLGEGIEQKSAALAEARGSMSSLLSRARETAAGQEQAQRAEMLRLTTACAAGLEEIRQEQERISEISGGVRSAYEKLAAEIGDMVMTLQCHDSVRQRLEHIVEALRRVRDGLSGRTATLGPATTLHNVRLQAAQLGQAQAAFLGAVSEIRKRLQRIGETVADYPRLSRELAGEDDRAGRMEERFTAIVATMTELGESRRVLSTAAREVQSACARMTGFVADIETLGERLVRLGLNAEVQAVQLARCGAVMESVASHIRRAAQMASDSAKAAGAALRGLEVPAARLASALGTESHPHEMTAQLRRMMADLSATQTENRNLLASISSGADVLAREIESLRSGITADEITNRIASSCLDTLGQAARTASAKAGRLAASLDAQALEHASANYTMHAERDAHQSFTSGTASPAMEVGGNVELF
jgi:chromosome segregation ATPase